MKKNILLTGRPGSGKSTLIHKVVEKLKASGLKDMGGFYTLEVREGGEGGEGAKEGRGGRTGFSITTLDGRTGRLAGVGIESRYCLGRYGIDMESFEEVALTALEEAIIKGALVVIDEIGYMELKSRRFRELLVKALDSRAPLLSTIMMSKYEFTDSIKSRPDVEVIRVNTLNRDSLVRELTEKISSLHGSA